ncbi:hypothetical protein [Algoriphagus halophilus]|uniref:Uncharacterized protein n=1 Tax=Algoriphagus halophilus TaxID=226505 RepID=A0A1N6ECC9_9BACT|nr:hypothetical protein [Algoriphagus halophilus]SIN80653.1 hypothetical protein SAMN05444394_1969 [Algoriphagus halophilus]
MNQNLRILLITSITLGTAWAIRGQFGHEQGAAWAGGIACIFFIISTGNKNWESVGLKSSLMGAIGWGLGGMMSYGVVVGYGRSEDLLNAGYGLVMLAVIGGLYGLLGGGLFGLGLEEGNSGKKVAWHHLFVEMTAGGIVFYYFIIEQLGILMTPPRSEAWAVCAGAGIALIYFMVRNSYQGALRTALFSAIGGGFGFAFGDFLQVMGYLSGIQFNFWNVMEYSLGFFGGLGMSYGAITGFKKSSPVPIETIKANPRTGWALFGLVFLIPLIVFQKSFLEKDLSSEFTKLGVSTSSTWAAISVGAAFLIWVILQLLTWKNYKDFCASHSFPERLLNVTGPLLFISYLLFSILLTGSYFKWGRLEQYLYILNFIFVLVLTFKVEKNGINTHLPDYSAVKTATIAMLIILLLAIIASSSHSPIPGAQMRF